MHHPPKTTQTCIFIFIGDLYPLKCEISGQQDEGFPYGVLRKITLSARHMFTWVLKLIGRTLSFSFFTFAGTRSASPTNRPPSTSGSARTLLPGCCVAATTPGWCATTARNWPSSPRLTCVVLVSCWTTMPAISRSTMPSAHNICTPSTSPLRSLSAPSSTCGTSV